MRPGDEAAMTNLAISLSRTSVAKLEEALEIGRQLAETHDNARSYVQLGKSLVWAHSHCPYPTAHSHYAPPM